MNKLIGFGKNVLEVGSGTSQLSIALASLSNNYHVALDGTLASLQMGQSFAKSQNVPNVDFLHVDLFSLPFKAASFDVVWCTGVLHHTQNPRLGFKILTEILAPDGLMVLGLYNRYGRLRTKFRQFLYRLLFRSPLAKRLIYFLDQSFAPTFLKQKRSLGFKISTSTRLKALTLFAKFFAGTRRKVFN